MSLPKSVYKRKPKEFPKSLGFSRYALDFDGVDDYVEVPDSPSLDMKKFTIIAWVKVPDLADGGARYPVIDKRSTGIYHNYVVRIWGDETVQLGFQDTGGTWHDFQTTNTVPINEWAFIAATYDQDNVKIWVNSNSQQWSENSVPQTGAGNLAIGGSPISGNYLNGKIDEVRIYDRALSESEIKRSMLNYHNPSRNGLVGWWRFEEGTGLTAHDRSGTGNDGTLNPSADPPTWVRQKKWEMRAETGL